MDCKLVLSVFPGIDRLGEGIVEECPDWAVVRGPDLLWGGDARRFHVPAGPWYGVLGGPPCQMFTQLRHLNPKCGQKHGNLIPEFERIVDEAQPIWFLMENVPDAPVPSVPGYIVHSIMLNNRWLGEAQNRTRRLSFGTRDGRHLVVDVALFESPEYRQAVTSSLRAVPGAIGGSGKPKRTYTTDGKQHGPDRGQRATIADMCVAQGYPPDLLDEAPFTAEGKRLVIGNGVPDKMARAIAKAIRRAMED